MLSAREQDGVNVVQVAAPANGNDGVDRLGLRSLWMRRMEFTWLRITLSCL